MLYVDLDANEVIWGWDIESQRLKRDPIAAHLATFLFILCRRVGRVVAYESLIAGIWGSGGEPEGNVVRQLQVYKHNCMKRLRKLGVEADIQTSHGVGYRLMMGETTDLDEFVMRCIRHRQAVEEVLP